MKLINALLPLAAITSAFIIPDEQTANQLVIESVKDSQTLFDKVQVKAEHVWSEVEETFKDAVAFSENAIDNAISVASEAANKAASSFECYGSMMKFEVQEWLDSAATTLEDFDDEDFDIFDRPHKRPKHPKHPHHGHRPHHGHHRHKSNLTVYQLIAGSKYTTKLAKLIDEYPDLVKTLNGTATNYTIFAPTDKAFEKLPKGHKPSKELIKKVLAYHVSPAFYPAGRIFITHTIPTALGEESLGGEPQRLRVGFTIGKGLNINFYSKIVAVNIVRPLLPSFISHSLLTRTSSAPTV
jgi:uncharacterized surface protein with fasciclin (FAS1) repeats